MCPCLWMERWTELSVNPSWMLHTLYGDYLNYDWWHFSSRKYVIPYHWKCLRVTWRAQKYGKYGKARVCCTSLASKFLHLNARLALMEPPWPNCSLFGLDPSLGILFQLSDALQIAEFHILQNTPKQLIESLLITCSCCSRCKGWLLWTLAGENTQ